MLIKAKAKAIVSKGLEGSSKFKIQTGAKMFKVLSSQLYSDKIMAVVREIIANAIDIHVQTNCDKPYDVALPNEIHPFFTVRDYGTGLSVEQIDNLYTTYFASTKDDNHIDIGGFGLGSKSPLAYSTTFQVTSFHGGNKTVYFVYTDDNGEPAIKTIASEPSDEPTGLEVNVPVNPTDFNAFRIKAEEIHQFLKLKPNFVNIQAIDESRYLYTHHEAAEIYNRKSVNWNQNFRFKILVSGFAYLVDVDQLHEYAQVKEFDRNYLEFLKHLSVSKNGIIIDFNNFQIPLLPSREQVDINIDTIDYINQCFFDYWAKVRNKIDTILNRYYPNIFIREIVLNANNLSCKKDLYEKTLSVFNIDPQSFPTHQEYLNDASFIRGINAVASYLLKGLDLYSPNRIWEYLINFSAKPESYNRNSTCLSFTSLATRSLDAAIFHGNDLVFIKYHKPAHKSDSDYLSTTQIKSIIRDMVPGLAVKNQNHISVIVAPVGNNIWNMIPDLDNITIVEYKPTSKAPASTVATAAARSKYSISTAKVKDLSGNPITISLENIDSYVYLPYHEYSDHISYHIPSFLQTYVHHSVQNYTKQTGYNNVDQFQFAFGKQIVLVNDKSAFYEKLISKDFRHLTFAIYSHSFYQEYLEAFSKLPQIEQENLIIQALFLFKKLNTFTNYKDIRKYWNQYNLEMLVETVRHSVGMVHNDKFQKILKLCQDSTTPSVINVDPLHPINFFLYYILDCYNTKNNTYGPPKELVNHCAGLIENATKMIYEYHEYVAENYPIIAIKVTAARHIDKSYLNETYDDRLDNFINVPMYHEAIYQLIQQEKK